jgi:hypothetical protein
MSLLSTSSACGRPTCSSPPATRSPASCTASSRSCWRYGAVLLLQVPAGDGAVGAPAAAARHQAGASRAPAVHHAVLVRHCRALSMAVACLPGRPHLPRAGAAVRHVLQAAGVSFKEDCGVRQQQRLYGPHGGWRGLALPAWGACLVGAGAVERLRAGCPGVPKILGAAGPQKQGPSPCQPLIALWLPGADAIPSRCSTRTASRSTACYWCTSLTAPPRSSG